MEQFVQSLIDSSQVPIYTALLLGILTSVSPCTFSTNIMVLAYVGKEVQSANRTFVNGLLYTLGRIVSYTVLGLICIPLLREGAKIFFVQKFISNYGGYIIAPILVLYGLFLLFGQKLPLKKFGYHASERTKRLEGAAGAFVLGLLFALAFCPISALFYFGTLLPMAAVEKSGYLFPTIFAIGSSILVILIAWIVAFGMNKIGTLYNRVNQIQKWLNIAVGIIFLLLGFYYIYLYYL